MEKENKDKIKEITKNLVLGCKNNIIPQDINKINSNAFYGCTNLSNIIRGNGVTSIDSLAFDNDVNIFYLNDDVSWNKISKTQLNATVYYYYYSESKLDTDNKYWHYDADGVTPVIWNK